MRVQILKERKPEPSSSTAARVQADLLLTQRGDTLENSSEMLAWELRELGVRVINIHTYIHLILKTLKELNP